MKNNKINYLKYMFIIRSVFVLIFIVSLFSTISVLANTNPFKIIDAIISDKSEGVTGDIDSFTGDEVKDNIKFHKLEDNVTYKLTLKNTRSDEVAITSISDDNSNDYIIYSYDNIDNLKIGANETFDFYIKAIYRNELEDTTKRNQINNVNFIINYLEKDNEVSARLSLNPNTSDNITISFVMLFISGSVLIVSFFVNKNSKKKVIKTYSIILIGIICLPVMVNAINSSFSIKLNDIFGLYDKVIVTYNSAGNTRTANSTYDEVIENLESPDVRDGYNFEGWELNGEDFDPNKVLDDDITLDARWSLIDYSIRYNLNNGTVSTANRENYNIEDEFTLNNPTRDGYKFTGWSGTGLNEVTKNVVIKNIFGNLEYNANWEPIKYTIVYSGLEEDEIIALRNKSTYTILDTITINDPTFRYDSDGDKTEKFVGWEDEDGNVSTNIVISNSFGNKTYTAKWEVVVPNTYTITYNLDNGSCNNSTSFTKKTDTFKLNNPSKDGYEFTGWSGTDLEGNNNKDVYVNKGTRKNLEFTAHYSPITYSISYDYNGGSGSNNDSYTIEDEVVVANPTRDYYDFVGWIGTGLSQTTKDLVIIEGNFGDKRYMANWDAKSYDIEYVLDNGVANGNPDTYTVEDTFKLNNPVKTGYEFTGWTGLGVATPSKDFIIPIGTNGKITLTANYVPNQYTVSFDANTTDEYTGSMGDQTFIYDTPQNLSENKYERDGYSFIGWNTQSDGLGISYSDLEEVNNLATSGNVRLYAQWDVAQAMFLSGTEASIKMKKLAGNTTVSSNSEDKLITAFKQSDVAPNIDEMTEDNILSVSEGAYTVPIYAWFDNGIIYWWSDDENPSLNSNSSYLFGSMKKLAEAEVKYFDTNELSNMFGMFYGCESLTELDLSNFDTSKVTNMNSLFIYCKGLTTLILGDNFDTHNVTTMFDMFYSCSSLTELDLGDKFDTSNVDSMAGMFRSCSSLIELDLGNLFDTSKVTSMEGMFNYCASLKTLRLGNKFNTKNVTKMNYMFYFCNVLEELDLGELFDTSNVTDMSFMFNMSNSVITELDLGSKFNTSNVTNMARMFYGLKNITELELGELFDTSKVTNMSYMFGNCSSLESLDLSMFNTSNVTNMAWMFYFCENLGELDLGNNFITSSVTDMSMLFYGCKAIKSLDLGDNFDTSNVKSMTSMFYNCFELESLDLGSKFNTSKVTSMSSMFYTCKKLKTLKLGDLFNTSNVTNMSNMFSYCKALESINLGSKFNTSSVTDMNSMFQACSSVKELDLGQLFDTSKVTNMNNMFYGMSELEVINLGSNFHTGNVTNMMNMFNIDSKLKTIYSIDFDTSSVTSSSNMFGALRSIVGGANTTYISSANTNYAHVDGGSSNPGYFTAIQ